MLFVLIAKMGFVSLLIPALVFMAGMVIIVQQFITWQVTVSMELPLMLISVLVIQDGKEKYAKSQSVHILVEMATVKSQMYVNVCQGSEQL